MTKYLIRRTIQMGILLVLISVLIFGLLQLAPGGPFDRLLADPRVSRADVERLNKLIGLDKPVHERYVLWLWNALRFDWGSSWQVSYGQPVGKVIMERFPLTIQLMGISTLLSIVIAIPIGIYSAVRKYSLADYFVTAGSFFGISMPTFWFGLMLMIVFAVDPHVLPTTGFRRPGWKATWPTESSICSCRWRS
jgi:peptide/nickel transport system permease protein